MADGQTLALYVAGKDTINNAMSAPTTGVQFRSPVWKKDPYPANPPPSSPSPSQAGGGGNDDVLVKATVRMVGISYNDIAGGDNSVQKQAALRSAVAGKC